MTIDDDDLAIKPEDLTPFEVLAHPKRFLKIFIDYWDKHLPDTSDGRKYTPEELLFWLKNADKIGVPKNKKAALQRKGQHRLFKGLCSKWLHKAIDFAMSNNLWPVQAPHTSAFPERTFDFMNHTFDFTEHTFDLFKRTFDFIFTGYVLDWETMLEHGFGLHHCCLVLLRVQHGGPVVVDLQGCAESSTLPYNQSRHHG